MTAAAFRAHCMSLPGATENIAWGADRVFKVGGKMFSVMGADQRKYPGLSFKASPESFHILTREPGIAPSKYLARAHWVHLDRLDALPVDQLKAYIVRAHALIAAGLSRKMQIKLGTLPPDAPKPKKKARARTAP